MSREKERLAWAVLVIGIVLFWVHYRFHPQDRACLESTRQIVVWSQRVDNRLKTLEYFASVKSVTATEIKEEAPEVIEDDQAQATEGGE